MRGWCGGRDSRPRGRWSTGGNASAVTGPAPGRFGLLAVDADQPPLALGAELDHTGAGGEDRVIAADAGAVTGPEAGAALADDDLAAGHLLAGEHLHAEELRVRVATVAAG